MRRVNEIGPRAFISLHFELRSKCMTLSFSNLNSFLMICLSMNPASMFKLITWIMFFFPARFAWNFFPECVLRRKEFFTYGGDLKQKRDVDKNVPVTVKQTNSIQHCFIISDSIKCIDWRWRYYPCKEKSLTDKGGSTCKGTEAGDFSIFEEVKEDTV